MQSSGGQHRDGSFSVNGVECGTAVNNQRPAPSADISQHSRPDFAWERFASATPHR